MSLLNLIKTGSWNPVIKAKKPRKNIIPIADIMTELGVRTNAVVGAYEVEERPETRTIPGYQAMQDNDGTVKAITRLFSMPIQSTPVKIIAGENDNGERQFIDDVFMGPERVGGMTNPLPFVIADMTRAIFEGFRVYEKVAQIIEDGPHKGKIGWKKLAIRDAKTVDIRADKTGGFMGIRQRAYFGGTLVDTVMPAEKCMLYTFQKEQHPLYGESILKTAYYHYDKKHKLYYLAHKKAEIDAVGLKILKLTKPTGEAEVNAAEDVIDTIGVNSRVTLPAGFDLEINRASSGYDVMPLINHHDGQMVLSTLAQAINMGTGQKYGYTYGKGYEMQGKFIIQMLSTIMVNMEYTLNKWAIPQLIDWNFGSKSYPKVKLMPLTDDIQSYLLSLFETLLKKDPDKISQGLIEEMTLQVAEKLGFEMENIDKAPTKTKKEEEEKEVDKEKKALLTFEEAKVNEANLYKVSAPATDKKTKLQIINLAETETDEVRLEETMKTMGIAYAKEHINKLKQLELEEKAGELNKKEKDLDVLAKEVKEIIQM